MSLQGMKLVLAPLAWRFLKTTLRLAEFRPGPDMGDGPFIFACLHRDILPAIMHVRSARPALLVSNSPDGDILIKTLGHRDYRFVRGATGSEGQRALVLLKRELEAGHCVGLAVDGPEGPFGAIREGVLHLARMTGVPVVPLVARTLRPLVLDTWDRTVVPIPFRRVTLERGPVLHIPGAADEEDLKSFRLTLAAFFGVEGQQ